MAAIRVLIVDDAVVIRRLVSDCLASDPGIEIAGTAGSGRIALTKIDELKPDLVTLDIEMDDMDGLETLRVIRRTHPKLPVIMFSTLTERGASATLDALAMGANDYVTKPANVGSVGAGMQRIREDLIPKIKALCNRAQTGIVREVAVTSIEQPSLFDLKNLGTSPVDVLAIGVSTGGPNALAELVPGLSATLPVPIVIVQHMPPLFTRLLAERLTAVSGHQVREGVADAILKPGEVWIAPGGFHMEVERKGREAALRIQQEAPENSCRPAVDVLFRSVANVYGKRVLAVVLTGMGQDGLIGCQQIRAAGGDVIVQDEATSVVWGMPGAVAQAGLASKILPLAGIAAEINRRVGHGVRPSSAQPTSSLAPAT